MLNLETPRLSIIPLTPDLMQKLLAGTTHLADLAAKTPDAFPWNTNWQIIWKERNLTVGSACFMSKPDEFGAVEIGYGIYPEFQRQGFMTEALTAIVQWVFTQEAGPRVILADAEADNVKIIDFYINIL